MKSIAGTTTCLAGTALVFASLALAVAGQPAAPPGISAELLSEIELSKEFETVDARRLRMRILTVPKGGLVGEHVHTDRPSLEYVLEGTATEFRDGKETTVSAGDAITADHTVTHSWRNDTDGDLTILAVDIYQPTE